MEDDLAQLNRAGAAGAAKAVEDPVSAIRDILQSLRFGSIAVTVHDGKVVQLDITEKRRLS
jgi:hypothetical protein